MSDNNESTTSIGASPFTTGDILFRCGEGLVTFHSDGRISVSDDINVEQTAKAFMNEMAKVHSTLPGEVERLKKELAESRSDADLQRTRLSAILCRTLELNDMINHGGVKPVADDKGETGRDTNRLDYIFNLINERGLSGFGAHIHWGIDGLDRRDIDYAMHNDGVKD